MNRIERISAILIQLQSKKIVKAQEIADRFGISLRTIYRDIRSLEASGVPLIGEAGVGYSLVDGYKLAPILFTKEEAISLVTAEKLLQKFSDKSTQANYESALYKIKSVLKGPEKEKINELDENIMVVKNTNLPANNSSYIQAILKGISEKLQLQIEYFTNYSQENSTRTIEPIGIFHKANHWYLIAYCNIRHDYRNFKIDRIKHLEITSSPIQNIHPSLKSFIEKHVETRDLTPIKIIVEKTVIRYLGDEKYYQGFVSMQTLADNKYELTFLSPSLNGFAHWYLLFAEEAEIIQPNELKIIIAERIKLLADQYLLAKK
jgi:predicted DNA-binding transcriptional regulator YafY